MSKPLAKIFDWLADGILGAFALIAAGTSVPWRDVLIVIGALLLKEIVKYIFVILVIKFPGLRQYIPEITQMLKSLGKGNISKSERYDRGRHNADKADG